MSPTPPTALAVTGATGRIGGRVARALAAEGVEQRLLVRDPSRAPALPGATTATASYGDGEAARRALDGVRTLFMVSGSETPSRVQQHLAFVDAAVAAGVEHLVYLSFQGAAPDATFTLARDHWATEEHIRASGLRWTFLRDSLYAEHLRLFAGDERVLRGPAGNGRVAAVGQDDVAEAATAVLRDVAAHEAAVHTLTGPQALTLAEAAATMSEVLGEPFRYVEETLEEAYASRARYRAPRWQVEAWVSTYLAIRDGSMAEVTEDVLRLTGHPARSLAEVLAG